MNENHLHLTIDFIWVSQVALVVKNLPANAEDSREMSSIPGSGRSPGGGKWQPALVLLLGEVHGRGYWWATYSPWVCRESDTTGQLSTQRTDLI